MYVRKIILIILLFVSISYEQELKHLKDVLYFSNSILELINKKKYIPALELIKKHSINDTASFKVKRLMSLFRKKQSLGFVKLHEKDLFNIAFKVSFLQKFDDSVVLIDFYFYKPEKKWYLYDISVKNDIKSFF